MNRLNGKVVSEKIINQIKENVDEHIKEVHHCKLHNCKVDYPKEQFCGDQHWLSIKANERLEKLKQLGI